MDTVIPSASGLNPIVRSRALFAMVQRRPNQINALSGPAPKVNKSGGVMRGQSTNDMPIVRVTDLVEEAGDAVRMDIANTTQFRAIMGDENAEGKGAKLDLSYMDIKIDMATLPVNAGGKMTRRRLQHDLVNMAMNQLKSAIPRFEWQSCLVHMAGGRGQQNNIDWIVPLATDGEFASQLINPVQAPTYNRHYVVDGSALVQGGLQLGSIDATDVLTLNHADEMVAVIAESGIQMMNIMIPGDPVGDDDPIRAVWMLDDLAWKTLVTSTATSNIRDWMSKSVERAKYGNLQAHPLFAGATFFWNGILFRRLGKFAIRWNADGTQTPAYVKVANRLTATESTDVTIPNLTSGANQYAVSRSLVLGGQALALAYGASDTGEGQYALLDNSTNYKRNKEMAGEIVYGPKKVRFAVPDGLGNKEPTDTGIYVVDSIVKRVSA